VTKPGIGLQHDPSGEGLYDTDDEAALSVDQLHGSDVQTSLVIKGEGCGNGVIGNPAPGHVRGHERRVDTVGVAGIVDDHRWCAGDGEGWLDEPEATGMGDEAAGDLHVRFLEDDDGDGTDP
jgi:hypothetical protein